MGIEHRCGVPLDGLWDLAEKQLAATARAERERRKRHAKYRDLMAWMTAQGEMGYALMVVNGQLEVVKVSPSGLSKLKLVEWYHPGNMPQVEAA